MLFDAEPHDRWGPLGSLQVWALSFAAWTLIHLFALTESVVRVPDFPWEQSLRGWAPGIYTRALLTPFALYAAIRIPITRSRLRSALPAHGLLGILWSVVYTGLMASVILLLWPRTGRHADAAGFYVHIFMGYCMRGLLAYFSIIGVGHALAYYRRFAEAEARLKEAQLEALRRQLNPHFLFNTLNTISILIDCGEAKSAGGLLVRFSELLRARLTGGGSQEVPLSDELELLESYLAIEKARFGERLRTSIEVEDSVRTAMIPPLLLQPVVENAIHHGVALREESGLVRLLITEGGGALRIVVSGDGPGFHAGRNIRGNGIGLTNTRARLAQLYGDRHRIEFVDSGEGVTVTIELPLRLAHAGQVQAAL
jgi:two-component system LytT family sensor kinase